MAIFISYSHQNKEFVDDFAANLVLNKVRVWVDRWEITVGESILQKIEKGIQQAEAILFILSKDSIESEYCKKEYTAGLVRELEERRVIVLPILLEDCSIPLFLKDKKYADFRTNFNEGLKDTLEALAPIISSDVLGRIPSTTTTNVDYALDWGYIDENSFHMRVTMLEQAAEQTHSIITEILITCNKEATNYYREFEKEGMDWFERICILAMIDEFEGNKGQPLLITDNFPQKQEIFIKDTNSKIAFQVVVITRRIGIDNGRDIVVFWGDQLNGIVNYLLKQTANLTPTQQSLIRNIINKKPK